MAKTRISSGWKIVTLGGCALVAFCGAAIFAVMLVSALNPQRAEPTVESQPEPVSTVNDVLVGHRWRVHFFTMQDGRAFEAYFKQDGSFDGLVTAPSDDVTFPASQQITGKWYIADDVLILDWDWIWLPSDSYHEQVPIKISRISQYNVQGVDREWDLWEFERID